MKKLIGILIAILAVAGIVLLLAGNRKKAQQQAGSAGSADGRELVTTYTVTAEDYSRDFTSNGVAQADKELNFVSEISGRVVEIYTDKGRRISKGAPMLRIDSELLEADYKATLASYEALKKDEERFTNSFEAGGITSQQLDNIRTQLVAAESRLTVSKWKLDNAVVKAPISGTVNNRFVETGALIAPNVPLFEIVDDSRIKVICNVPETKVRLIKAGQKVTATSNDSASKTFTGTIRSIGVKTDRGLNYPVEVLLDSDPELHVGLYLKVSFQDNGSAAGILIPRKAIVGSVLSAYVFVARDGVAERRSVKLGDMFGDRIEILEGLQDGDEIVIAGLMNIADGTPIKIVND